MVFSKGSLVSFVSLSCTDLNGVTAYLTERKAEYFSHARQEERLF